MYKYSRQVQQTLWTDLADSIVRFGRFRQIWWITRTGRLWSDLADFGRLRVQADSMVRFGRFWQIWWFTSTAADFMVCSGRFGGLQA